MEHKVLEHAPAKTSEESAKLRNTPLEWGAKTMIVCKPKGEQVMLIYPAHRKLSWTKVKKVEAVGKKFERAEQGIEEKLHVRPGGIPPFPSLFGIKGVIDQRLLENETIAFNAGMTTRSVIMKAAELPLADCTTADICED